MRTGRGAIGVVGIDSDKPGPLLTPDERRLLDALIDQFYTADVFMHTWDIARATGQDDRLDEAFVADLDAVGGVEALPVAREPLHPRVRLAGHRHPDLGVRARVQVARDVACGDADLAKGSEGDVRDVLADALLLHEGLRGVRAGAGRAGDEGDPLVHGGERLLGEVLGVVDVSGEAVREPVDPAGVLADDLLPRRGRPRRGCVLRSLHCILLGPGPAARCAGRSARPAPSSREPL